MKKIISKTIKVIGMRYDQTEDKYYFVYRCTIKQRGKKRVSYHKRSHLFGYVFKGLDICEFTKPRPLSGSYEYMH